MCFTFTYFNQKPWNTFKSEFSIFRFGCSIKIELIKLSLSLLLIYVHYLHRFLRVAVIQTVNCRLYPKAYLYEVKEL